jgi:uncharacterized membrane protein
MIEVPGAQAAHDARGGPMPGRVPRPAARTGRAATSVIFWLATVGYAVAFSAMSLREYHAYIPNALDLGNMAQAFWNTVHGHPFRFQNMRVATPLEAFGTSTRLSFHVEPLLPFLAIVYACYQHVETLLVLQSLAIASGAIPVRLLARQHLQHPLAELAFPLAYLLYPALEAANLFEFHPVTSAVPLLLWAFYCADTRRYTLFCLAAVAAMGCKEELGALVALMGLWIALRQHERRFGACVALLGLLWSFLALKVVVAHFSQADSAYWDRYLPAGFAGSGAVTQNQVLSFWLHHLDLVWSNLTSQAKLSYLHRILNPAGYLPLLSPLTLLCALPSLAIILLSYEPHMVGGLDEYSAEIVPVMIVAAILGTEWLAKTLAPRIRVRGSWVVAFCSLYVLFAALANQRVNGFTPMGADFYYPPITAHDHIVDRALALIPPNASVSAQNNLDPHLSDRGQIYLYPDLDSSKVEYIALDATQPTGPLLRSCDLTIEVTGDSSACDPASATPTGQTASRPNPNALLRSGKWTIVFAQDGVLLLKRHQPGEPLNATLPPAFYTFLYSTPSTVPSGGPIARFGNYLELEGFAISRADVTTLRNPDVVVTTWWRVLGPVPAQARIVHYLTNTAGALQDVSHDQPATDWSHVSQWQPGKIYEVVSTQMAITTSLSGSISVYVGLSSKGNYQDLAQNAPVTVLKPATRSQSLRTAADSRLLKVTGIQVLM